MAEETGEKKTEERAEERKEEKAEGKTYTYEFYHDIGKKGRRTPPKKP